MKKNRRVLFQNKIDFIGKIKGLSIIYGILYLFISFSIGFKLLYFIYFLLMSFFSLWVVFSDVISLFTMYEESLLITLPTLPWYRFEVGYADILNFSIKNHGGPEIRTNPFVQFDVKLNGKLKHKLYNYARIEEEDFELFIGLLESKGVKVGIVK